MSKSLKKGWDRRNQERKETQILKIREQELKAEAQAERDVRTHSIAFEDCMIICIYTYTSSFYIFIKAKKAAIIEKKRLREEKARQEMLQTQSVDNKPTPSHHIRYVELYLIITFMTLLTHGL